MSYTSLQNDLNSLLSKFDGFGWIPCRGVLSLDLMQQLSSSKKPPHIPGDVDRYLIAFKDHTAFKSEWFIAATSIKTTYDKKYGSDYNRTFRYFLTGSIHNEVLNRIFLESHQDEGNIKRLLDAEGAFIGTLVIVPEDSSQIPEHEIQIINEINELRTHLIETAKEKKKNPDTTYDRNLIYRQRFIIKWLINRLPHQIGKTNFVFEVFLSRDGLLFLKDTTMALYRTSGNTTDYIHNTPLPPIFLMAMNYIKHIFHTNYYHQENHDACLPISNLHAIRLNSSNFYDIFRHQLDCFTKPIIELKRKNLRTYTIDPEGVLYYANAFVLTCKDNSLISDDVAQKAIAYLAIQENEIKHLMTPHRTKLNNLIAQRNLIFILSTILGLGCVILSICDIFVDISEMLGDVITDEAKYFYFGFLGLLLLLYFIYEVTCLNIRRKEFHPKRKKNYFKRLFCRNSKLQKARLSFAYARYIKYQDFMLWIGQKGREIIRQIILWVITGIVIWLMVQLMLQVI